MKTKMPNDKERPTPERQDDGAVSDVRAARRALAARFGYDVRRLCEFYQQKEKERPAKTGSPRRRMIAK
jgi:hypothetical protein